MPSPMAPQQPGRQPPSQPGAGAPRVVSEKDKALGRSLSKAIEKALRDRAEDHKAYADNRKRLRGFNVETGKKLRTNLHFANLAAMRPQVYAKDPEFTVQPSRGVPDEMLPAVRLFGETSEAVLEKLLVQDAQLKRRAKRILTSCYTNAVGWWKVAWQEGRPADSLITNRIKDTQDNQAQLEQQQRALADPGVGNDADLQQAQVRETAAGLQSQAEVRVGRGAALDFVLPEDMLVLDPTITEIQDYLRSDKLAHGVWMTREQFERNFGFKPEKARVYRSKTDAGQDARTAAPVTDGDKGADLLRVWEIWDQGSNRVHTICTGEEGLCRPSYTPDWTGRRWYPFFLLTWNDAEGGFSPQSDVELTDGVVIEYNEARSDFEKDRRDARPFTLFRKGGALTPDDVANIRNRKGNDLIGVEGVGTQPLSNDIQAVTLGQINPANYDTTAARQDMEMLVGGGDAARGAVLKAKTATEAEILSQGLRGRSAERTDVIEDLLSEVGGFVLEMCLRKLTPEEVQTIAGPQAQWPQLSVDDILRNVSVRVRGGSTGKPDRLQEQDRWTKLLPVIKDTVKEIVATRQAGQEQLAQLAMALLKETLRRFDERFEVEQYLPEQKQGEQGDGGQPEITPEMVQQAKAMIQELQDKVAELQKALDDKTAEIEGDVRKAEIQAGADIEKATRVARIDAAAKVEVARITSAVPPLQATPEPSGLVQALAAVQPGAEPPEAPEVPELGMGGQPMPPEVPGQPEGVEPLHGEDGMTYQPGQPPDPD